jgi:hypothetical protein
MCPATIVANPGSSDVDIEVSDDSKLPLEPLVSVCMVTYQHAAFIREALDSVLMQKVDFPYEICIGEDGSTDGTREICLEYAKKHPDKIRLFLRNRSNPARKLFEAPYMFNGTATFDAGRGKYIALLEGDDYWLHPHKLQLQVNQLEADSSLAGSCHYALIARKDKPWACNVIPEYSVGILTVAQVLRRDVGSLHTSTWLLRRAKPLPWADFQSSFFGDYPIIVWSLLQGSARVFPNTWSAYRIHEGGVFSPLSAVIRWQNNVELWNCLKSITPSELQMDAVIGTIRTITGLTTELRKAGDYKGAIRSFRRTLAEIDRLPFSNPERRRLWWSAFESLFIPRLQGIRRRWNRWKSKR